MMTARAVGGRGSVRTLLVAGRVTTLVPADHLPHRRVEVLDELEFGLVTEWVNGLDSLQSGLSEPEVVEEED